MLLASFWSVDRRRLAERRDERIAFLDLLHESGDFTPETLELPERTFDLVESAGLLVRTDCAGQDEVVEFDHVPPILAGHEDARGRAVSIEGMMIDDARPRAGLAVAHEGVDPRRAQRDPLIGQLVALDEVLHIGRDQSIETVDAPVDEGEEATSVRMDIGHPDARAVLVLFVVVPLHRRPAVVGEEDADNWIVREVHLCLHHQFLEWTQLRFVNIINVRPNLIVA